MSDAPLTILVSPVDAYGKRSFTARGADGEYTDRFHPDDSHRRDKFVAQAARVACEPDGPATTRAILAYFYAQLRQAAVDAQASDEPRLVVRCAASIERRAVDWLWPGRLPIGSLAMFAGDPGLSKSTLSLDIAARVTRGAEWPDGRGAAQAGGVVVLSAEDDAATTIVPRLEAHGADLSKVAIVEGVSNRRAPADGDPTPDRPTRGLSLASDLDLVRDVIDQQGDTRLLVIDPISAYTPGVDTHRNADVRGLLAPLASLAAWKGITVLCVTHLNKSQGGPAVYRTMGSLAYIAAARVGHLVARDPDDAERRLWLPIKNNLAPDRDGLAYTIVTDELPTGESIGRIEWEPEPVLLNADELSPADNSDSGAPRGRRDSRTAEAEAWLTRRLGGGGAIVSRELLDEGSQQEGFGEQTLRKAARRLGVEMRRDAGHGPYRWRLPASKPVFDKVDHSPEVINLVKQPEPAAEVAKSRCQHEWSESPSTFDGYVRVACQRCGESLGDVPLAA
ncbi:hypothetical protein Pla108_12930 [Botrimarina colliarenosi]|uniref:AAA+ ATPase domain-containing protein n=1 Tax=Botrimarina colliarenosi TaxID=2528001 RepID=A0A5C6AQ68_9BACT|nr:AAA family ATPase [Botrimarina colliarenosi]TWU00344.1 hypothetical protein Pla108_12930 [Botrimarina colliarenosi]